MLKYLRSRIDGIPPIVCLFFTYASFILAYALVGFAVMLMSALLAGHAPF